MDPCSALSFHPTVIARFMRATHGDLASIEKMSVGGPHKAGHDDLIWKKTMLPARPAFAGHDTEM